MLQVFYFGYFIYFCKLILIFYRCIIIRNVAVECIKYGKKVCEYHRIEREGIVKDKNTELKE